MTKKDYIKIAEVITNLKRENIRTNDIFIELIDRLCEVFKDDNSNFNEDYFKVYCNYSKYLE